MLAYKIVMCSMLGFNTVAQIVKTAQAVRYKQGRLTLVNAIGLAVAVTMLVWTYAL